MLAAHKAAGNANKLRGMGSEYPIYGFWHRYNLRPHLDSQSAEMNDFTEAKEVNEGNFPLRLLRCRLFNSFRVSGGHYFSAAFRATA